MGLFALRSFQFEIGEPVTRLLSGNANIDWTPRIWMRGWIAILVAAFIGLHGHISQADEPARRFVEQLRSAGLFDMALEYLDRAPDYPGVRPEFLQELELERAQTYLEAGQQSLLADQRNENFSNASAALTSFLANQPNHPRRSEAQLDLANLQLLRGSELMELGGPPDDQRRAEARTTFTEAATTFDQIVEDLRTKLKAMQGQKLDPATDVEQIALRDTYRKEFLSALLMGGDAKKRAAGTFAQASPEQETLYLESLTRFDELSDKYSDSLAGVLALLYAGEVHLAMNSLEEAADRFLSVVDQSEIDVLRAPKVKAITGLIKIDLAKSPPNYQVAIDRGQPWADDIRPDERTAPEFLQLRLELAKAYLGSRDTAANAGEKRRAEAAARTLLRPVAKVKGPYQASAESLLAELGIGDPSESVLADLQNLPNNFEDAFAKAREVMEEEKSKSLTAQLIERRASEGESLEAELEQVRTELKEVRDQGVELLRYTLTLAGSETTEDDLVQARYWLAYLLLRSERFREAAVVGDFVARRYPGNELGLFSGLTAINAWQGAYRDASPEIANAILPMLQRTAEFVVGQWPDDPQASSAKEMLVRIAIGRSELEKAKRFMQMLAADDPARLELQQSIGRLMWNDAIEKQKAGDTGGAKAVRTEMIATLSSGLSSLTAEQVDANVLRTAMLLARAQLLNGETAAALETLENQAYGPLARIDDVTLDDALAGEVYANGLQAIVSEMTNRSADSSALLAKASKAMDGLQKAYQGQPDGETKLVQTFFRLARDIREQMENATPDKQRQLMGAFQLFLDQLAAKTDDAKTLHWAAQTLLALAQGQMQPGSSQLQGEAKQLVDSAVDILTKIEAKASSDPSWLESDQMRTQIRLELGTAARLAGDYKTAIDTLAAVLKENQMLVDAQIEAALTYEQWATKLPDKYATISYGRAISGAKPDPSTKRNTVWGWGGIAKRTMTNESFREQFFDARYHLALCRYLQGKRETDAGRSKKLLEQAKSDIRNVQLRFSDLGGPTISKRFDSLLRQIQKDLGEPASGLAAFES